MFSSPGLVAGAGKFGLFTLTVGSPAGGLLGGVPAFDPDGSPDVPVALGSGVSAANAVALVIRTAAKSKLGTRNILSFSLSHLLPRKRRARAVVPSPCRQKRSPRDGGLGASPGSLLGGTSDGREAITLAFNVVARTLSPGAPLAHQLCRRKNERDRREMFRR